MTAATFGLYFFCMSFPKNLFEMITKKS